MHHFILGVFYWFTLKVQYASQAKSQSEKKTQFLFVDVTQMASSYCTMNFMLQPTCTSSPLSVQKKKLK